MDLSLEAVDDNGDDGDEVLHAERTWLGTYNMSNTYNININRFVNSNEQKCSTVKRASMAEK